MRNAVFAVPLRLGADAPSDTISTLRVSLGNRPIALGKCWLRQENREIIPHLLLNDHGGGAKSRSFPSGAARYRFWQVFRPPTIEDHVFLWLNTNAGSQTDKDKLQKQKP
jgi:hypothetical protein